MSSAPENPQDKKVRDALITALDHQIPAIEVAFNNFKTDVNDYAHPDRAQKILSELIKFVGTTANQLRPEYESCISSGEGPEKCAVKIEHILLNGKNGDSKHGLNHFFRVNCRTYFTKSEASERPCSSLRDEIFKALDESFSGGCKTSDPSKRIGGPKKDLTCLMNAITEANSNLANYSELDKAGKIIHADSKPRGLLTPQESKDVANNVANGDGNKPHSIEIGDQHSKPDGKQSSSSASSSTPNAAHKGNYSADRSPASSQGDIASNSFESFDNLKKQLAAEPSPTSKVFQGFFKNANQVMSKLAIPEAEARTRSNTDTSSLSMPAPAPLAFDQPTSPRDSTSGRGTLAGLIEASRASSARAVDSVSSAARKSVAVKGGASDAKAPDSKDRTQSTTAKADGDGKASADAGKQKGRSSGSSSDSAKSTAKVPGSKKGQTTSGASAAGGTHIDYGSKAADGSDHLSHLRNQFLKHFKDKPKDALARLKSGALSQELRSYFVEAIDDQGHAYGSNVPHLKIWYENGIFKGLPDDL
jgi:hypothetical protein